MEDFKDFIKDKRYKNWVKCTLGIALTGKAVCEYVSRKFTMYLQGKLSGNNPAIQYYLTADEFSHFRDPWKEGLRNNVTQYIKLVKGKWHLTGLPSTCECPSILEKILSLLSLLSLHKKQNDIQWKNIDDTKNLSPEWVIAKIFMPRGNEKNKGPDDTDPSAIFKVMKMCTLFTNTIKAKNIDGVLDARNALFHSSDNLVEHGDMEKYFEDMEYLLFHALNDLDIDEDLKRSIVNSKTKIVRLKKSEMTMTLFEDAQEAMRIKRAAIYYEFDQCLCENDPVQLQELLKLAEKLGTDLEFVNNNFVEIKTQNLQIKQLETLRENNDIQIQDLEDRLKKERMENKERQEEISNIKVKIRKLEESEIEATKENGELQDKIKSQNLQIKELETLRENNDIQIQDLEDRLKKERMENKERQEEISNIKVKIRKLEESENEATKENIELQDKITNDKAKIRDLEWETVAIASGLAVTTFVFLGFGM